MYFVCVNIDKVVGDNIRGYRKKKNLTQEALAIKAGMSPNFLSAFEHGKETLSLKRLEKLVRVLKIETYLLFIPESYKEEQQP
jgi:transcriptional regulator with XRE-family HTH domain